MTIPLAVGWLVTATVTTQDLNGSHDTTKSGDFLLATTRDRYLATSGYFFMATDMAYEARAVLETAGQVLHDTATPGGPADAYDVMGSVGLILTALQGCLDDFTAWGSRQEHRKRLTVVEGPFVDDPDVALEVAIEALGQASAA